METANEQNERRIRHPFGLQATMHRPGHFGTALLLWAPIGAVLISAGLPHVALFGGVIMVTVEEIPDIDLQTPFLSHRGVTHSLGFALAFGFVLSVATVVALGILGDVLHEALPETLDVRLVGETVSVNIAALFSMQSWKGVEYGLGTTVFVFGVLGIVAHLAADVITPAGIPAFWPLSSKRVGFDIVLARNWWANTMLLLMGVLFSGAVVAYALGRLGTYLPWLAL